MLMSALAQMRSTKTKIVLKYWKGAYLFIHLPCIFIHLFLNCYLSGFLIEKSIIWLTQVIPKLYSSMS